MRAALAGLALTCVLLAGCTGATSSGTPSSGGGTPPSGSSSDAAAAGGTMLTASDLVRERCTRCHKVERIKKAQHDKAGWEKTVARMRGKGAKVDDAEAARIVDFLANGGGAQL
jgi:cytochrome c5